MSSNEYRCENCGEIFILVEVDAEDPTPLCPGCIDAGADLQDDLDYLQGDLP